MVWAEKYHHPCWRRSQSIAIGESHTAVVRWGRVHCTPAPWQRGPMHGKLCLLCCAGGVTEATRQHVVDRIAESLRAAAAGVAGRGDSSSADVKARECEEALFNCSHSKCVVPV